MAYIVFFLQCKHWLWSRLVVMWGWSFQVKVAILKYIETLTLQMEPQDFVNSSETRLAVSRIITWTTEPKSSDVRKVGENVYSYSYIFLLCLSGLLFTFLSLFKRHSAAQVKHFNRSQHQHLLLFRKRLGADRLKNVWNVFLSCWRIVCFLGPGSPVCADCAIPVEYAGIHHASWCTT